MGNHNSKIGGGAPDTPRGPDLQLSDFADLLGAKSVVE